MGWCWAGEMEGNLGTEDGANSECTKMIILFILKVDSHIFHCWVSKILLCWDGKPKAQLLKEKRRRIEIEETKRKWKRKKWDIDGQLGEWMCGP